MLELRNVTKKYDGKVIFEDISLKVNKGEIVSILGPSGCGKTTLLHIILGLTDISSGRLAYDKEDITRVPMKHRGFNIVFQDYALFPNLNVKQNIEYGLRNRPNVSTQAEVDELVDLLEIKTRIREIAERYELTTLIVTHDPEEAMTLSDRILLLSDGKVAQYAKPSEIIKNPANDFVKSFILNQLNIKRRNILSLFEADSVPTDPLEKYTQMRPTPTGSSVTEDINAIIQRTAAKSIKDTSTG